MKKAIFTALSLFLFIGITEAQNFKLGVKAGVNFTDLKTDNSLFDSKNNAGYQLGIWGRLGGNKFHFQPEAYFTSKNVGFQVEPNDAGAALIDGDLKFSNIDIPLLLGTRFPIGPIAARIQAGPLFSFVIDQETSFKNNVNSTFTEEQLTNYKDSFSALVFGVGLDISKLAIDLRYEYGLGNISKYDGQKQTLNLWSIGLGYSLF